MRKAPAIILGIIATAVAIDALLRRRQSFMSRLFFARRQSPPQTVIEDLGAESVLHEGCREEVLAAARILQTQGHADFSPGDIIEAMRAAGTRYAPSTIRTHVVSRMCADAPDNHATTYDDLERIGRGRYRLR